MKRSTSKALLSLSSRPEMATSGLVKDALGQPRTEIPDPQSARRSSRRVPRFRADESVRDGLTRMAGELIRGALNRIVYPGKNRAEDLHHVRLAMKRLRALLRLARPVISEAFYHRENHRLKAVAQRLSRFRDQTVLGKILSKLTAEETDWRGAEALCGISTRLAGGGPEARSFRVRRESALRSAARSLVEANQNLESMLVPAEDWPSLVVGLQAVYRRARKRMLRALTYGTDEAFHDWRKEVKYLHYQLQMLGPAWPVRLGKMVRRLNKLESRLGQDHDFAILKSLLLESPERGEGRRAVKRVAVRLRRQSRKLRREAEELGSEIFQEKPRKIAAKLAKRLSGWRREEWSIAQSLA